MKYRMIAKTFPAYHPKAGQPTGFRDSILMGRKVHTLRITAGGLETGDLISLREWEGKPYASRQIEFARCRVSVAPISLIGSSISYRDMGNIAWCDGFPEMADFLAWFKAADKPSLAFRGYCLWFRELRPVITDPVVTEVFHAGPLQRDVLEALEAASEALEELGGCDNQSCGKAGCNHALAKVRAVLERSA